MVLCWIGETLLDTMKILITGASKGIGAYLFEKLLAEGFSVYGTYNSTLPANVARQHYFKVDITNQADVDVWIQKVVTTNDDIILVNCAGINYSALARKTEMSRWEQLINVNLIGTFRVIRALLPFMHQRKFGRIINFSSVVAQKGVPGTSAYAASKAALWGVTKCLAVEMGNENITINTLNLGYFDVGMIAEVPDRLKEKILNEIPNHQLGDPENIYQMVKLLIKADYINGAAINVNGGLY